MCLEKSSGPLTRLPREFGGPGAKDKDEASCDNFQGLEINYGIILLVCFMRPPEPLSIGCFEASGNLPPRPPLDGSAHRRKRKA